MKKFPMIDDLASLVRTIKSAGQIAEEDRVLTIQDAVTSTDLGPLLPHAIVEMMVEVIEPLMVLTPLLDRVQVPLGTTEFKMPAIGTFSVERVGEGESYPEKTLNIGGALSTASIDKWGVALAFTEEAIAASRWDLINLHVREAGRAFARRREVEVARHIQGLGNPLFDNRNPTDSHLGVTHGRGATLAANGTITMDDMFDAFATMLTTGFTPDLMIMHPLTWIMFVKDPTLRAFAHAAGGGVMFGGWTGSPVNRYTLPGSSALISGGNRGASVGTALNGTPSDLRRDFSPALNAAPILPSYLPQNLRIVVSPFVPFDPASKLTDIYLASSNSLGALLVAEDITMDEWKDPSVDIRYMKLREKWGIMIQEEGLGIGTLKNIKVAQNFLPEGVAAPTVDYGDLAEIPAATAVV